MTLIQRFLPLSDQSFFLLGPRGTGKSTWLKEYYPNSLVIDLLNPAELRHYHAYPERLFEVVRGSKFNTIIIDEIQKIPELLSAVHSLIEEKKGWQFILTGSSARKLKRSSVDLMAGRAIIRHMHPFMASELGNRFSLTDSLQFGLVPLIVESTHMEETLKAYIGVYLNEEVRFEGLVRNIGDFARFLEIVSFSHGSIINISNIARECSVSRKLIEGYLNVLQDLLLSFHLPIFSVRAKRELISHEKFYYFDVGVYKSLRLTGYLDKPSEIDGPGLEGLVLQNIRAWNDYSGQPNKLFYWRTRHGVEVDIIIYGKNEFYAIEIKNSVQINDNDLKPLKSFLSDYPEATAYLLYRGKNRILKNGILCLPVEEFLLSLKPGSTIKDCLE